jgi:hypothetical protein
VNRQKIRFWDVNEEREMKVGLGEVSVLGTASDHVC